MLAYGFPGAGRSPLSGQELRERIIHAQTGKKVQGFLTVRDFEFTAVGRIVSRVYMEQTGLRWIYTTCRSP